MAVETMAQEKLPQVEGRTLSNDEAAVYIGVTPGTLRVWVSKRRVPFVRVGRKVRFRRKDLDAWMDKNSVPNK